MSNDNFTMPGSQRENKCSFTSIVKLQKDPTGIQVRPISNVNILENHRYSTKRGKGHSSNRIVLGKSFPQESFFSPSDLQDLTRCEHFKFAQRAKKSSTPEQLVNAFSATRLNIARCILFMIVCALLIRKHKNLFLRVRQIINK